MGAKTIYTTESGRVKNFRISFNNEIDQAEYVARRSDGGWMCSARIVKIGTADWTVKDSGAQFHGPPDAALIYADVLRLAAAEARRRNDLTQMSLGDA